MKKMILELSISGMLVVTSADLLYLYAMGSWYDPIKAIEVTEILLLGAFIILGLFYSVWRIQRELKCGI